MLWGYNPSDVSNQISPSPSQNQSLEEVLGVLSGGGEG